MVFVLSFSYVALLRNYCGRVAGLSWRYIALAGSDYFYTGCWTSEFWKIVFLGVDIWSCFFLGMYFDPLFLFSLLFLGNCVWPAKKILHGSW